MPRPTVHDIAKNAGVSLATVDRVLNQRPGVRPATVEHVQEVIEKIGYVRDVAAANLARQRNYQFVFVVPDLASAFFSQLSDVIHEAKMRASVDRMDISIVRVPPNDPHALVTELEKLDPQSLNGIAIMAPETPHVRDAIKRLKDRGVSIVGIISDLPNSDIDQFVGINNMAAGRTAGLLLGRFLGPQPAEILVLAGSMQARDHVERRQGFDAIMTEKFPHVSVLPTVEAWDDSHLMEELVSRSLAARPEIRAIYSIASGNSGLAAALSRRQHDRKFVIVHELTDTSRNALERDLFDAVIKQDVGHIVRSAVRMMRAKSDGRDLITSQEKIRIEVILKENLN